MTTIRRTLHGYNYDVIADDGDILGSIYSIMSEDASSDLYGANLNYTDEGGDKRYLQIGTYRTIREAIADFEYFSTHRFVLTFTAPALNETYTAIRAGDDE